MDCIFCKIAKQEIPTKLIYDDDLVVAFNDIHPKAPHHILIIPRQHIATLNDLDNPDLGGHLLMVAKKLAAEIGIADAGYRLIINCNRNGGQEVFHLHLHLLGGRQLR